MPRRTISRRGAVGVFGATAVAVPLIGHLGAESPETGEQGSTSPADLFAPLRPGSRLARWQVVAIGAMVAGAVTVELRGDDGQTFRLEVLARDPSHLAPRPPGLTERLAVYVANGGDGWLPTVEDQGLAAMTLAEVIRANEARHAHGFLTHAQRVAVEGDRLLCDFEIDGSSRGPTTRSS